VRLLHVDAILFRGLYVLVFIHHDSRFVRIAGVTSNPVASWVTQCARNISMELADQANSIKLVIRDRDTKSTASFDVVFAADGTRVITTPVRESRANAICERVIGAIRRTPLLIGDVDLVKLRRADRLGGLIHEYRMVA
jgi:putative transposase